MRFASACHAVRQSAKRELFINTTSYPTPIGDPGERSECLSFLRSAGRRKARGLWIPNRVGDDGEGQLVTTAWIVGDDGVDSWV